MREREEGRRKVLARTSVALGIWGDLGGRLGTLAQKADSVPWPVALPLEDLEPREVPEGPEELSVLAADGSQIYPDRHEVSFCYLINIGRVALHYGTGERPTLEGRPYLFFREEEVHPGGNPASQEAVSLLRSVMEREALADMAGSLPPERTALALVDGPLRILGLEEFPAWSTRLDSAMDELRDLKVPVAGYTSYPGGREVTGLLRLALCPKDPPDCPSCDGRPCEEMDGVPDRALFARVLREGERSSLFSSGKVSFFYLNTGWEVARVEVPPWVAGDPVLLKLVHACVLDQARKGRGYPVALSEAHELAAVKGRERERFYRMVEEAMVRGGMRAERSMKEVSKRRLGT